MPDFTLPNLDAGTALARHQSGEAVLIDLRKPEARTASGEALPGALIRDPFALGHDDPLTEDERPLIVFCVHGHEVSQFACALLMLHGRDVHYVEGGFAALKGAGAETQPLGGPDGKA
ncbi:MAG: hypothetical protein OEN23_04055 [Paracoccaceae bacterium]|nr:hypothetical protein [Paracoccaceae bacterium]